MPGIDSPDYAIPQGPVSTANRRCRIAFLLLAVLQCSTFWVFPYYPTQDGASHLHNAAVLANYGSEAVYRQYYTLTLLNPAGNLTTQYLLAGLIKIAGASLAEKLLLTGYVLLFFFSFRWLVKSIVPDDEIFPLFAGLMVSNWFLEMGFWNYIYSVGLMMWLAGYYLRRRGCWTAASLTLFCLAGIVLYSTHVVSWTVCLAIVGVWELPKLFSALQTRDRAALLQRAIPVTALLPPVVLALLTFSNPPPLPDPGPPVTLSLREHLWPLYSFSFMNSNGGRRLYAATLEAVFAVLVAGAAILIWRGSPRRWRAPEFLTASVVCVVMVLVGPDTLSSGGMFIHRRLVLCACIFLAAWLAGQNWPAAARKSLPLVFFGLSIILFAARIPDLARWNQRISDFMAMQDNIRPRSSLLWLNLQQLEAGPDPYRNATGMLAAKSIIDLRNYEAVNDLFLTRYRPEHAPFPAMGKLNEVAGTPPKFDIATYERTTHDRADYIIFQGPEPRETQLFPTQLANYLLIHTSRGGGLRLYERKAGDSASPPAPDK